jgi:hypothetical protein
LGQPAAVALVIGAAAWALMVVARASISRLIASAGALDLRFAAFSSREPEFTSAENALARPENMHLVVGGLHGEDLAVQPRIPRHGFPIDIEAQGLRYGQGLLGHLLVAVGEALEDAAIVLVQGARRRQRRARRTAPVKAALSSGDQAVMLRP